MTGLGGAAVVTPRKPAVQGPVEVIGAVPAIAVSMLSKRFGRRTAVRNVSFTVRTGHIHGLLGPNGAGKTTTLRLLLGTVRPDAGTIEFGGAAVAPDLPRGQCGVAGFVGTPGFYPYLTASRNVELLSALTGPAAAGRVEELLTLVGLADRAQSKVRTFSTGMRQRLALAAALIGEPDILIVDEPAAGLDPAGLRALSTMLTELTDRGCTVVLSSHDLDEVERLCSDVTVLREGEIVYDGSMAGLHRTAPNRCWRLHTTDDDAAAGMAAGMPGIQLTRDTGGLLVESDVGNVDGLVLALAANGVAVRELSRQQLALESLFFQLTEQPRPAP